MAVEMNEEIAARLAQQGHATPEQLEAMRAYTPIASEHQKQKYIEQLQAVKAQLGGA